MTEQFEEWFKAFLLSQYDYINPDDLDATELSLKEHLWQAWQAGSAELDGWRQAARNSNSAANKWKTEYEAHQRIAFEFSTEAHLLRDKVALLERQNTAVLPDDESWRVKHCLNGELDAAIKNIEALESRIAELERQLAEARESAVG